MGMTEEHIGQNVVIKANKMRILVKITGCITFLVNSKD